MQHPTVGIVGAGGISRVHADAWRALGWSALVYSTVGADALAAEYGFTVASTLDELLDRVDVVDIVTPSTSHADIALAAIERGRHVVCEKPLAATAEAARQMSDAAHHRGVRLFPAHVVRYFGQYRAIRDAVISGSLGDLAVLKFSRAGSAPLSPWFFTQSRGGGVIRDLMIHDIDQALWLAGPVVEVFAQQSPPTVNDVVPVPVTAQVVLTHSSGAISHLQASWLAEGMPFRTRIEVAGSRGRARYDSAEDPSSRIDDVAPAAIGDYLPPMSSKDSPYFREISDFVAAISSGGPAEVTPADGVAAVIVAEAAYESLRTGAPVAVSTTDDGSEERGL